MKVRVLRGVCIGVDRHLKPGDTEDLDAALVNYLVSIQAVEALKDEPVKTEVKTEPAPERGAVASRKEK